MYICITAYIYLADYQFGILVRVCIGGNEKGLERVSEVEYLSKVFI